MTPELRTAVVEALREAALRGHGPDTDAEDNASDLLAALERAGFDVVRRAPAPAPVPALCTASDLACACQVDLKTIHNWVDRGRIPHFRTPGRHLRFKYEDVVAFMTRSGYPPETLAALTKRPSAGRRPRARVSA